MESKLDQQENISQEQSNDQHKAKRYTVYGNNNPRAIIEAMNRRGDYVQVLNIVL